MFMWAAASRWAVKAWASLPAFWASTTALSVWTWVATEAATASAGRDGTAELMNAPKSLAYWVRSLTAWAALPPSPAARPCA